MITVGFRFLPPMGVCSPWASLPGTHRLWVSWSMGQAQYQAHRWPCPHSTDGSEQDQWHRLNVFQIQCFWKSSLAGWRVGFWLVWGRESLHRYPADNFLRTGPLYMIQMMRSYRISHVVRRFCSIGLDEIAENTPWPDGNSPDSCKITSNTFIQRK